MCGILCLIGFKGRLNNSVDLIVSHRGPDFQFSKIIFNDVILSHSRLSIIDLSPAGHQPMSYANDRYWMVYNGEVYNYRELREELEALGHRFKSHTDTEVVLASYAQWGKECLHRFNGMWAFIILDTKTGMVFASRDRFGVKPLYYWYSPEGFLSFASEIKQFTVLPGWSSVLNGQRAHDFLTFGLIDHTRETLFKGVFQIRGGEAVVFSALNVPETLPVYHWYNLKLERFQGNREEAAKKFRDLLTDAVRLRLRSDVPIGSCLSGGLDSSSIVCLVNDILREHGDESVQKTFSAFSREMRVDESQYIKEVVSCRNIESLSVYPEMEDLFKDLDKIIWHQDEPFDSTSIFAQWKVFKLASQHHVKVMLDGQGADEILGGYHYFFGIHFAGLFIKLKILTLLQEVQAARQRHGYRVTNNIGQIIYYTLPGILRGFCERILPHRSDAEAWFNLDLISKCPVSSPFADVSCDDPFTDQCYNRLLTTNLPALLHWEDRNSMAFSIESRVPFLDYRLVEFSLSLPAEHKIHQGITKKVLRDAMTGLLPEKILNRKDKLGFATPEEEWMRRDPYIWRRALEESIVVSRGLIKSSALERFDEVIQGDRPFCQHIWRAICLGKWMRIFNVVYK